MPRKTICLKISKGLPAGFAINRGIIYKASYQHVIRGFLIEGSSWKGTYRLHNEVFLQQVANHLAALEQGVDAFRSFQRQATTEAAVAHGFCPSSFGDARDCRA